MENGITSYNRQNILGKSPIELVITVYNGAINALSDAEKAYGETKDDQAREHLERARKFIIHLYTTLDFQRGGVIAENLGKMYTYLIERIMVAEATHDTEVISEIRSSLGTLKSGWDGVQQELSKQLNTARNTPPSGPAAGAAEAVKGLPGAPSRLSIKG